MHDTNNINTSKSPSRAARFVRHAIAYIWPSAGAANYDVPDTATHRIEAGYAGGEAAMVER